MLYDEFRIRNFKGIKDTTIRLSSGDGPNVYAFVGLNESGKTTILEAIHSFYPDKSTSNLMGGSDGVGIPYKQRVPRHLLSTFEDDVSVQATLRFEGGEKAKVQKSIEEKLKLSVEALPDRIILEKHARFKGGDLQHNFFTLRNQINLKSIRQKTWRPPSSEELIIIRDIIYQYVPIIAYFPTFVFAFPASFYLTDRGSEIDRFYRGVFQDILDHDGRGVTIEKDITRRVRTDALKVPWYNFLTAWQKNDDKPKIEQIFDRAGAVVTDVVFGRWNTIFGEDAKGKEIIVTQDVIEGVTKDASGNIVSSNEHDISVKFQIKDGSRRFNINDRSLGFRWFFCFMLFTQFRVARSGALPILFLFDEPASNLHAAAQHKLIESFPSIASGRHALIYSTHSHYMIEPKWLEQTFIVTNRADEASISVLGEASLDDESLDVRATPYRQFVNNNPNKTSYFQPILDRLEVIPSRFDIQKKSIILEGKSDYYIMRYGMMILAEEPVHLIPGCGAGTFGSLMALSVGWGLNCLFILDSDKKGIEEKARYIRDFAIDSGSVINIGELVSDIVEIESLFDETARQIIASKVGVAGKVTKSDILRFCQECLAANVAHDLGLTFRHKTTQLLGALKSKLG